MLIDEALPDYDATEKHAVEIEASAGRVYAAVRQLDLSTSTLVRILFALRGLPALIAQPSELNRGLGLTLDDLLASGFVVLHEQTDVELVLGLVGRFWTPSGEIRRLRPEEFRGFEEPGFTKAAWNFALEPLAGGATRLATETRVRCTDEASRRRFRFYWFFIRPFSGLIRREMLRALKQSAERRD